MPLLTPGDVNARSCDPADKRLQLDQTFPANGLTALAGGGQANAVTLTNHVNRFTTVATIADSTKLPPAVAGMYPVTVINAAANSLNVFPALGDAINAGAANAAFAVAGAKTATFYCAVTGTWNALLSA